MIQIYRNNAPHLTLPQAKEHTFLSALMAEHKITVPVTLPKIVDVQIGDYLIQNGVKYSINTVPEYQKVEHTQQHRYEFTFEHPIYRLYDKLFMFEGNTEFPYFGIPEDYVDLILSNINSIDKGWTKGQIDLADEQHISFDGVSCRVALTTISEAFGMEFYFDADGKRLNLVAKVGVDRDITLEYGKGKGLYTIKRSYVEDQNIVTRAYGVGGNRNLPEGYTNTSLQLSAPLEANIDLYGVKEGIFKNEDIFPTRTGIVTTATPYDPETKFNTLTDVDLDFDINDYLAPGLTAKIGFQNGDLAGYEFEITKYDHATKTITYLTNTDTSEGLILPNENLHAKAGDKYKLLDIYLPQSYVDAALTQLQNETQEYLDKAKFPRVAYEVSIDVLHFKRNGYELNPGDRVRIIDKDINVDMMIRVTSLSYPLAFPETLLPGMQYTVELANDFIPYTVQERIQIEVKEQKKAIIEQSKLSKHTRAAMEEIARAAALNQFERTYIGQLAILTGALVVGNPELGAVAGISGLETALEAIRFFAGSDFENRDTAPFRVQQNGKTYMSDADIANGCKIGAWRVSNDGIVNDNGEAYIIARKFFYDVDDNIIGEASSMIGANILSSITGLRAVGKFENTELNPSGTNYGLIVKVANALSNVALDITGDINLNGVIKGFGTGTKLVAVGYQILNKDDSIIITSNSNGFVYLPDNPEVGQMHFISHYNENSIEVSTGQLNMRFKGAIVSNVTMSWGDLWQWDGNYWNRLIASSD